MFKNRISLFQILGLIFLAPSILFGGVLLNEISYNRGNIHWNEEFVISTVLIIFGLIGSIGLIAKQQWARFLIIFDLTILF